MPVVEIDIEVHILQREIAQDIAPRLVVIGEYGEEHFYGLPRNDDVAVETFRPTFTFCEPASLNQLWVAGLSSYWSLTAALPLRYIAAPVSIIAVCGLPS